MDLRHRDAGTGGKTTETIIRLSACERAWAKFNEAKPGSFRLYPNESQIDGLRKDYAEMGKMIFDKTAPSFGEILCALAEIEGKINGGNQ